MPPSKDTWVSTDSFPACIGSRDEVLVLSPQVRRVRRVVRLSPLMLEKHLIKRSRQTFRSLTAIILLISVSIGVFCVLYPWYVYF